MNAAEEVGTAARARAILAEAPALRDSLSRVLGSIVSLAPDLVDGHNAAEAGASLSGLLSLTASRNGLKVVRLDLLPDSGMGVFRRVGIHAEVEGDVRGVIGMLKVLETGTPLISVTALAASVVDPVGRPSSPEVLQLECEVTGYYLPRGNP